VYQQYTFFIDTVCAIFGHESSFNDGLVYLNQDIATFFCSAAAMHKGTSSTFNRIPVISGL
jgi:hypothetical protein